MPGVGTAFIGCGRGDECLWYNQRKLHPEPYNRLLPVVNEVKFLGLYLDNKLSFLPHMKYLKTKCLKAMNLLINE